MLSNTGLAIASAVLSYLTFAYLRNQLTSYLWSNGTVLDELSNLGKARAAGDKIKGTAVIAGCSLSGLMVARVCADHFETVVVVDPESWLVSQDEIQSTEDKEGDEKSDNADAVPDLKKRSRVPQYNATHVYQTISLLAYRKCFPDWDKQYISEGAIISSRPYDLSYSGVRPCPFRTTDSLPEVHYSSRPVLESLLRRNVIKTCSNVSFLTGSVIGISSDPFDSSRISSVSLKLQGSEELCKQDAMVAIDCTGAVKTGLKWLAEAGYGKLPNKVSNAASQGGSLALDELEIAYHSKLSNSTSTFIVTPEMAQTLEKVIPGGYMNQETMFSYLPQSSRCNRGIGTIKVLQNQLSLFAATWGEFVLPETAEEYQDFARSVIGLRPVENWVYDVIDILFQEKPITTMRYRDPPCVKVQYEKAANLPSNFIAIGDACTRFNPVFGQGTSQGVLGACILDSVLRSVPAGVGQLPSDFGRKFFGQHARKVSDPIWMNTKSGDYGFIHTVPAQGESRSKGAWIRWYSDQLMRACSWSAEVRKAHNEVWMFMSPPISLFAPRIVAIVLYQWWTGRVGL